MIEFGLIVFVEKLNFKLIFVNICAEQDAGDPESVLVQARPEVREAGSLE